MMKVRSSPSDVETRRAVGWVSILWFTAAVSSAAGQGVTLHTTSQEAARCGENLTLTCEASSSRPLDIKSFSWLFLAKNKSVCVADRPCDPEFVCDSAAELLVHRLSVTLLNVMPANQGDYLCKLHSTFGAKDSTTTVTVQDCLGGSGSSIKEAFARCWFSGVYPSGTVHWSQGKDNFTRASSTLQQVDHHGRYNVSSSLDIREGNPNQPYACSLWIPSAGKTLASLMVHPVGKQENRSSGGKVQLQWICVLVGIMTFMI
ncbi:hypothetical protein EYF80_006321 [Liparis tanakae]|uniref:Ig-like domain-containing protein n=1 Tax=Liparis tanakae TaxID=230148 RepID=A0A4Z2IZD2_9TELE|nr:hypothetical protein EYF80_006321 [Liparis tanakae]